MIILVVAVGVGVQDGCGVDHVVFVDVLGSELGNVVLSCAGSYGLCVIVHVEVGGELSGLVADELCGGDLAYLNNIDVANELLLQTLATVCHVAGRVPDADGVVLEVCDAQLVGERLLNGNLCGVGVQDLYIVFTVEVVIRESVRLVVGVVALLCGNRLYHTVV